jgi:hypothetical protein
MTANLASLLTNPFAHLASNRCSVKTVYARLNVIRAISDLGFSAEIVQSIAINVGLKIFATSAIKDSFFTKITA